jgi:hypothetical protein
MYEELINKRLTGMPGQGIIDINERVLSVLYDYIPF